MYTYDNAIATACKNLGICFNLQRPPLEPNGTELKVSEGSIIEEYAGIFNSNSIPRFIGAFSYSHSPLSEISIGRYCSISWGLHIITSNHPLSWVSTSPIFYQIEEHSNLKAAFGNPEFKPPQRPHSHVPAQVNLGHDVWIGENVTLGRNVTVGTGAVVAANSLVVKNVPPYAIVGGNPAKIIRFRFPQDQIDLLLQSEWWHYHAQDIVRLDPTDVTSFCSSIRDWVEKGIVKKHLFRSLKFTDNSALEHHTNLPEGLLNI